MCHWLEESDVLLCEGSWQQDACELARVIGVALETKQLPDAGTALDRYAVIPVSFSAPRVSVHVRAAMGSAFGLVWLAGLAALSWRQKRLEKRQ
jgi:hypothetical protein